MNNHITHLYPSCCTQAVSIVLFLESSNCIPCIENELKKALDARNEGYINAVKQHLASLQFDKDLEVLLNG